MIILKVKKSKRLFSEQRKEITARFRSYQSIDKMDKMIERTYKIYMFAVETAAFNRRKTNDAVHPTDGLASLEWHRLGRLRAQRAKIRVVVGLQLSWHVLQSSWLALQEWRREC